MLYSRYIFYPLALVLLLLAGFSTSLAASASPETLTAAFVTEELTTHEWTLREIVQSKNDTATNLTVFMLPCEKDNILDYNENGTYVISEGAKLCKASDDKIKGEGDWEYDEAEKSIVDRYNGGRRIYKRVLELSPGMLKVEYEGEGGTITTLTYFSELGKDDESLQDLIEDNSDYVSNLELIPREAMLEARRYIVVGRSDFDRGQPIDIDDKNGLLQKVFIYPFIDATNTEETLREDERNQTIIAQAKKSGIDYVVTGAIIKAEATPGPGNRYEGDVKYSVSILDVATSEESNQHVFDHSDKKAQENEQKDSRLLGSLLGAAIGYRPYYGYYGYNSYRYRHWNSYYDNYFLSGRAYGPDDDLGAAFSDEDQEARKKQFYTSLALMNAINETSEELGAYIMESLPVTIPINEVNNNKRDKFQDFTVEAGNNIGMKVGEKVNLVRIETKEMSNGDVVKSTTVVAGMVVKSVEGTRLATVSPLFTGKKKIQDAINDYLDQLYIQTTELKSDDD